MLALVFQTWSGTKYKTSCKTSREAYSQQTCENPCVEFQAAYKRQQTPLDTGNFSSHCATPMLNNHTCNDNVLTTISAIIIIIKQRLTRLVSIRDESQAIIIIIIVVHLHVRRWEAADDFTITLHQSLLC